MSNESRSDYEVASEATETAGEGEIGDNQEHPLVSELNGWREAITRLISVDSCVLAYMSNCIRLTDIDYGAFLQYADKVEKENCTLQRCQSIWHLGITQLAQSTHSGLQRRARTLLQKWSRKEYASRERTFDLYLKRKRGLDAGSLEALAASDNYWNKLTCHYYKLVDEGQQGKK